MAVAFKAAGTFATGASPVPYPAGTAAGDLLLVMVGSNAALTTPSGWTKQFGPTVPSGGGGWNVYFFYKIAGGSEPSSLTLSGQNAAFMVSYTGAHATTPIDVHATAQLPTSGTTGTTPSVTTTVANTMLLRMCWEYATSGTVTPGVGTERVDGALNAPLYCVVEMADIAQAGIGASGTAALTFTSALFGGLSATVAIAPAGPSTTTARFSRVKLGDGLKGTDNTAGVMEVDALTLSGTGAPTAGVGMDGAIYMDVASGLVYGPKAAGAWPATPITRPGQPAGGSTGQVLTKTSATDYATGWRDNELQPAVRAYHNANHSIGTSSFTYVTLNSERFDQAAGAASTMHDGAGATPTRVTCRENGVYLIIAAAVWAANATGSRSIAVQLNRTTNLVSDTRLNQGAALTVDQTVSTIYDLVTGDYVEIVAWQNSGGALNIGLAGTYSPGLSMVRVG